MSPAGAQAAISFCSDVTVRRPEVPTIVLVIPGAQFFGSLSAYDGTLAFTSRLGIRHPGATVAALTGMI